MNEKLKDNGIKKAVKTQPALPLPSNFTYRTMLKVTESARLREKKSEQRTLYALIATSILLLGGCLAGILIYLARQEEPLPIDLFPPIELPMPDLRILFSTFSGMEVPSVYFLILLLLPILLGFDYWIRKRHIGNEE